MRMKSPQRLKLYPPKKRQHQQPDAAAAQRNQRGRLALPPDFKG
jgi:hypothetical protein